MQANEYGYEKAFDHVPTYSEYNGKAYLLPNCSLRLKDSRTRVQIVNEKWSKKKKATTMATLFSREKSNEHIIAVNDLLSQEQCNFIRNKISKIVDMQCIEYDNVRKNKRLVIFDKSFASLIWKDIEPILRTYVAEKNISLTPLGFSVSRGSWDINGVNEAMRFNRYDNFREDKFGIHRDAQFCPSGDMRSIMSLVIYLNDDFGGGETKFYLPKNMMFKSKGMNVNEEIAAHGGLTEGFQEISITPKCGNAVLFSQSILHEGRRVIYSRKYIIKTDVMVIRKPSLGFKLSQYESEDFLKCLNYFRTAQQNELKGKNSVANDLYEKCLSLRYAYPGILSFIQTDSNDEPEKDIEKVREDFGETLVPQNDKKICGPNPYLIFPYEVWCLIFSYVYKLGHDAEVITKVFPILKPLKRPFDAKKIKPELGYSSGVFSKFTFDCDISFVKNNLDAFCRVLTGFSLYLMSQTVKSKYYIVDYNECKGAVALLPLQTFLESLFYEEAASCSTAYLVRQCDKTKEFPEKDFHQSVERSYMLLKHGKEFCGIDLETEYECDGTLRNYDGTGHSSYDRSSSEDESTYDSSFSEGFNSDSEELSSEELSSEELSHEKTNSTTENIGQSEGLNIGDTTSIKSSTIEENIKESEHISDNEGEINPNLNNLKNMTKDVSFEDLKLNYFNLPVLFEKYGRLYDNLDGICLEHQKDSSYKTDAKTVIDSETLDYVTSMHEALSQNCLGGAIVRALPHEDNIYFVKSSEYCQCGLAKSLFLVASYMKYAVKKYPLNYLLFDFSKQSLKVSRRKPDNDIMYSHLKEHVENYLREFLPKEEEIEFKNAFCVDVSTLSESSLGFNHASCQCSFPSASLNKYVNMQSYPHVKNVYIIFKEIERYRCRKIYAWCCYGGIVAM